MTLINKRYAPVAVFTYKRLEHTQKVLSALNDSNLAMYTHLYIFCDNYKNDSDRDEVNKVREYIDSFSINNNFSKTVVIKSLSNNGLAKSIIDGVTDVITEWGKIIVVEDDMLVSKHFIEFMNNALDFYAANKEIWSISGYSFPMNALLNYNHDIYMSGRASCWGWASWIDRWITVDWSVLDYKLFANNKKNRKEFAKWGKDLPYMLDAQMITNHNSWAIRWSYSQFKQGKLTVYPKISYVKNIGNDGSGTHGSNLSDKYNTTLNNQQHYECRFELLNVDEQIRKEFSNKYSMSTVNILKTKIKFKLIKSGILSRK